jgi:hypothetical protein
MHVATTPLPVEEIMNNVSPSTGRPVVVSARPGPGIDDQFPFQVRRG